METSQTNFYAFPATEAVEIIAQIARFPGIYSIADAQAVAQTALASLSFPVRDWEIVEKAKEICEKRYERYNNPPAPKTPTMCSFLEKNTLLGAKTLRKLRAAQTALKAGKGEYDEQV